MVPATRVEIWFGQGGSLKLTFVGAKCDSVRETERNSLRLSDEENTLALEISPGIFSQFTCV